MNLPLVLNLIFLSLALYAEAASRDKPHGHQGVLKPFDGKHVSYSLDEDQTKRLNAGDHVTFITRADKNGRGTCIQDVNAPVDVCMAKIRDLANYKKMVPKVKNVEIYSEETFQNGTIQTGAYFTVGVSLMTFNYYLLLTYDPELNTLVWTLDYKYNSDFDDNTGHWQVLPHPVKRGWSRVLYSSEVRLFPWIPEFVVAILTKTALVEATTWVRKESEAAAKKLSVAEKDDHAQRDESTLNKLRKYFGTNPTLATYKVTDEL